MKVLIFLCFVAFASTKSINVFDSIPIHQHPLWQIEHPEMTRIFYRNNGDSGRIIGGSLAEKGQFPHQAVLNIQLILGTALCGGSMIHENWILTAAHCLDSSFLWSVNIGLGSIDRRNGAPGYYATSGISWKIHENYDSSLLHNDIAVIKMATVPLTSTIEPIPLSRHNTAAGSMATVSGWGLTSDFGSTPNILNYVGTEIIENSICASTYGDDVIVSTTICSYGASCSGDSGGPLIYDDQQIGVVSFGASESCANYPSGYTRVSQFISWIEKNTNGDVLS